METYLDLGSAPTGECCAQVGTDDYAVRAKREYTTFIHQLRRMFGPEPSGARLSIRSNPHDFGTYYTVVCFYDPSQQASMDYAFTCERETPQEWDTLARKELGIE